LDCFLNQDETVLGCRKRLPIVRHDPATGIYHNRDNPVSVGIDERDYWLVSGRNHSRSARAAELAGYLGELGAFADRIANGPLGVDPDALGAELREQGDPGRLEVVRYQQLEPVSLSAMANLLFGSSDFAALAAEPSIFHVDPIGRSVFTNCRSDAGLSGEPWWSSEFQPGRALRKAPIRS
jgi:hypothetical protein